MQKVSNYLYIFLSSKSLKILHKIFYYRCFTQLLVLFIILFDETMQFVLLSLKFFTQAEKMFFIITGLNAFYLTYRLVSWLLVIREGFFFCHYIYLRSVAKRLELSGSQLVF